MQVISPNTAPNLIAFAPGTQGGHPLSPIHRSWHPTTLKGAHVRFHEPPEDLSILSLNISFNIWAELGSWAGIGGSNPTLHWLTAFDDGSGWWRDQLLGLSIIDQSL
jgi:hypothetical protein